VKTLLLMTGILLSGCSSSSIEHTRVCYQQTVREASCRDHYKSEGFRVDYTMGMTFEICCEE
jgi:hypothetical protein